MTLGDLIKRIDGNDLHKMLLFKDEDGGWSNVNVEIGKDDIYITCDTNQIFSSDK